MNQQKYWIPFEWIRVGDRIEFLYGRDHRPTTGTVKILNSQQRCAVVHVAGSSGANPALVDEEQYVKCLISEAKRRERTALATPWWAVHHPLIT